MRTSRLVLFMLLSASVLSNCTVVRLEPRARLDLETTQCVFSYDQSKEYRTEAQHQTDVEESLVDLGPDDFNDFEDENGYSDDFDRLLDQEAKLRECK